MCIGILSSEIQLSEGIGLSLTGLILPHLCACPKPGSGFPMPYVLGVFVSKELKWEVVVDFVDIGGIVDHHCCNMNFRPSDQNGVCQTEQKTT